jgi:hypothetical protein
VIPDPWWHAATRRACRNGSGNLSRDGSSSFELNYTCSSTDNPGAPMIRSMHCVQRY